MLNEEARITASCQKRIKRYRAVLQTRYQVADGDGGRKVDRKGPHDVRDRTAGSIILMKNELIQ